ncbi:MAG TPA: ABC transporter permease [Solirubrobacteraceae bacterium]|jgi:ABC-2 type transport system permease protein|nr:ABC transporter permease [Solirubrobacteraceae bacterium]
MNLVGQYLGAVTATVRRDAAIFVSYRLRIISQVLGTLLSLATFYYVAKLVKPGAVGPRDQYFAFAMVGILTTSILTSALTTAQIVRMELMAGNFERVLVSPMGPIWGVVAIAAFPIGYATLFASAMLGISAAVFGIPLHVVGLVPAFGVAVLGALSLAAIGLLFVAALLGFKSAMGATWVIAGLSLLGGAYFPLRLFPGWIRWTSEVQPFTPTVDLLRHLLVGTAPSEPVWLELVKLVGFTAVLAPLALGALALALRVSRRRGTIMEY